MSVENSTHFRNVTVDLPVRPSNAFTWSHTLFLSICILSSIILISTMLYCIMKRKRLNQLRHRLVPLYHFDAGECEDWEEELVEDAANEKTTYYKSISSPEVIKNHSF